MPRLGVNIDHVATIRQARGGREPDPVWAAVAAELGGADGITVHLREDRRHIQDRDLPLLKETVQTRLNLEAAISREILQIVLKLRPDQITFVPERREELTTEGGLDVLGQKERVGQAVAACRDAGIFVSLFVDPDPRQVEACREVGADAVELHTGRYADSARGQARRDELDFLIAAGAVAVATGMHLHAGHGLNLENVEDVARIAGMEELNIGHSLVARAVFVGLERAVREMKECLRSIRITSTG